MEKLTKENFLIFAAQHYQNPHCTSLTDFEQDLKRFVVARTIMRNYYKRGALSLRLLLNHVIICNNMFGPLATSSLFFYYCESNLHPMLVAILDHLSILPENINIRPDPQIQEMLRNQ